MPDKLQPLYAPFSAGVDNQAHPQQIRPPYLRHANNVDYRRDIGPQKREGLRALPTDVLGGGNITKGSQLVACGDELLCCDDQAVYSWSPQASRWVNRGELRPVTASTRPTAVSGAAVKQTSGASIPGQGLEGVAWIDVNGLHVSVQDVVTGTRVIDDVVVATGRTGVKLVATSATMVVLSTDATGAVYTAQLLPAKGGIGTELLVVAGINQGPMLFDVCYDGTVDGLLLAYMNPGQGLYGLLGLRANGAAYQQPVRAMFDVTGLGYSSNVGKYAPPSAQSTCTGITVAVFATATGAAGSGAADAGRNIVVCKSYLVPGGAMQTPTGGWVTADYMLGNPAMPITFPLAWTQATSTPIANAAAAYNLNGPGLNGSPVLTLLASGAVYDPLFYGGPTSYQMLTFTASLTGGLGLTQGPSVPGAMLICRPFTLASGRTVAWFMSYTTVAPASGSTTVSPTLNTPTAYLFDLQSRGFCARIAAGVVDPNTTANGLQTAFPRGTNVATSVLLVTRLVSAVGVPATASLVPQSGAYDLVAQSTTGGALQAAVLDNAALFAGGITYHYDGANVVESGFFAPPDLYVLSTLGVGQIATPGTIAGTWQYQAIWEWYDARGRRHRSAPSRVVTVTFAANTTGGLVSLRVQPLQLTRRRNIVLTIYRTQANLPVFYQVTDSTNPLLNNPAVTFLYPTDGLADAAIGGNEALYTGGGELPNDPPPASSIALRARTRILLAGGEYPDTITYSKQNDIGSGVQFSLALQKRITAVPGSIVAMAALDDKVVVFKTAGICYFQGTGVTSAGVAAGNNDDFSDPVILSTDLWCVAPNSVATTADGVYFMSQKGMYLIDHGLAFYNIGAPVAAYNSQTVTSVVSHPTLQQVRVGCSQDTALIYHPRKVQPFGDSVAQAGAWTTYSGFAQVAATSWAGQYALLRVNGQVCLPSATYDDDGCQVVQLLRTGWLTGTQALTAARFGALVVIGDLADPNQLLVDMGISYESTPVARLVYDSQLSSRPTAWGVDATWGAAASWGGDATSAYIFRCRELPEQVVGASAVQFTFSDAPSPTSGKPLQRGASLHGYAMLVEPLAQIPSLPDKQSL